MLETILIRHEGVRLKPYRDSRGFLTIGVGRCLDKKGISWKEARFLLHNDIMECVSDLKVLFPKWEEFSLGRKQALLSMRFNLGRRGFRSFKKLIKAVLEEDWERAAAEAADSKWCSQVGRRCQEVQELLRNEEAFYDSIKD